MIKFWVWEEMKNEVLLFGTAVIYPYVQGARSPIAYVTNEKIACDMCEKQAEDVNAEFFGIISTWECDPDNKENNKMLDSYMNNFQIGHYVKYDDGITYGWGKILEIDIEERSFLVENTYNKKKRELRLDNILNVFETI